MTIGVHKWLVFVSACVVMMVPMGLFYSLGALFVPFMSVFQVSRTEASLVQSVAVAVSLSTGLIHGLLVHRFGMVMVGLAGSCLASIGLGLSYFATSIYFLTATIGIAMSIGSICMYIVSSAAVGKHFTGNRSFILLSVVNSCSGIGGMVFPFILAFLILHGTLLICAGLVMNTIPCALLWSLPQRKYKTITVREINSNISDFNSWTLTEKIQHGSYNETARPDSMHQGNNHSSINYSYEDDNISLPSVTQWNDQNEHSHVPNHMGSITNQPNQLQQNNNSETTQEIRSNDGGDQTETNETTQEFRNNEGNDQADTNIPGCNHQYCNPSSSSQSQQTAECTDTKPNHSKTEYSHNSQDITLCKSLKHLARNKSFVFFIVGLAFSYPPIMVLLTFIVDTFQDSGLSTENANIGLLLLNACGIVGRLLPGIMMQSKFIKTMAVPIIASLMTAACMTGFILTDLLHLKLVFLSLTGVSYGMFVSCFSVTALGIVGADHLGNAIGFSFTLNGLANIAAGPISGFIRDSFGSYLFVFLVASGVQLIAVVMFVISHRLQYSKMETALRKKSVHYITKL